MTITASPRSTRPRRARARLALLLAGALSPALSATADAPKIAPDDTRAAAATREHPHGHPRELVLAGGALRLCASLAPKSCTAGAPVHGPEARSAPQYSLALGGTQFEDALNAAFDTPQDALRAPLAAVLQQLRRRLGRTPQTDAQLEQALARHCMNARGKVGVCRDRTQAPWAKLDDHQRMAMLAALELPQRHDGERRTEQASLAHSANADGVAVLRAFVDAASARADGGKPRIAVVTASSFDPFDPVDMYLSALREAGAEAEWWPVDAALAAAVFDGAASDGSACDALPRLRVERMRLPGRERIYPDLVAQQRDACTQPETLRTLPERVQGVFFTGGDQWALRRAFFHDAKNTDNAQGGSDRPNAWLIALRAAWTRGDLVVGGTSAGSAVQSGAAMLSNGSSAQALRGGAIASPPPVPGCGASGRCPGGLHEDALTYWPGGGLGLAQGLVVDTHFSERARELRLLRLLHDSGARFGIGMDETSALHLRWRAQHGAESGGMDGVEAQAIGAHGGWVFDAQPGCRGDTLHARALYLTTGQRAAWDARGLRALPGNPAQDKPQAMTERLPEDALADGALRALALRLGQRTDTSYTLPVLGHDIRVTLTRSDADVNDDTGTPPVLDVRATPWPGCAARKPSR